MSLARSSASALKALSRNAGRSGGKHIAKRGVSMLARRPAAAVVPIPTLGVGRVIMEESVC